MIPDGWQPETMMGPGALARYRKMAEAISDYGMLIEIGCFHGGSIAALADVIKKKHLKVVAVDLWDGAPNPAPGILTDERWAGMREGMLEKFRETMRRAGLITFETSGNAIVKAWEVLPVHRTNSLFLQAERADLVFVDACHTYEAVKVDLEEAMRLTKKGGKVAGHDYCRDFPGVVKAVDERFGPQPFDPTSDIWEVQI